MIIIQEYDSNIVDKRGYNIVKANTLIRHSKYDLTNIEQKIILRIIQMIKPEDKDLRKYQFDINEFCEICNIHNNSGSINAYIRDTLKKLRDKSFWIQEENQDILCGWISEVVVDKRTGIIHVYLSELLKPYLLELKKNFTEYSLYYILSMKSKYSIRMYEFFKSYEYQKQITLDVDELKTNLFAANYIKWSDFKRNVLDRAIGEINKYSDINVSYTIKKQARKNQYLVFKINHKDIDEKIQVIMNNDERLLKAINDDEG